MRYVHPTPEHKREAVRKLERYNLEQVFARYKKGQGPHKIPHSELSGDDGRQVSD